MCGIDACEMGVDVMITALFHQTIQLRVGRTVQDITIWLVSDWEFPEDTPQVAYRRGVIYANNQFYKVDQSRRILNNGVKLFPPRHWVVYGSPLRIKDGHPDWFSPRSPRIAAEIAKENERRGI